MRAIVVGAYLLFAMLSNLLCTQSECVANERALLCVDGVIGGCDCGNSRIRRAL